MPSHNHRLPKQGACLLGNCIHRGCHALSLLLKGWSEEQHQRHRLGACWKQRIHITPRPTESELQFHKVPRWFIARLKLEKHCSVPWDPISLASTDCPRNEPLRPKHVSSGWEEPARWLARALCSRARNCQTETSYVRLSVLRSEMVTHMHSTVALGKTQRKT